MPPSESTVSRKEVPWIDYFVRARFMTVAAELNPDPEESDKGTTK